MRGQPFLVGDERKMFWFHSPSGGFRLFDFLLYKYNIKNEKKVIFPNFDASSVDNHFLDLSLLSLLKEWNSSEDEEWDTILSQMPSIS